MASSATGMKRARSELVTPYEYPSVQIQCPTSKRVRRLSDDRVSDLPTILKSDRDGFTRYEARVQFLSRLQISEATIMNFLQGLGSDFNLFLSILDLNLYQNNILQLLDDFRQRDVPLTTLNITAHAFIIADKSLVLRSFQSAIAHQSWLFGAVNYIANYIFAEDDRISIKVLSGGGVRDILVAEWCKMYNLKTSPVPPQVIFVESQSGKTFLIPYMP